MFNRSGNEDAVELEFMHPQCKLAIQSQEAMKELLDADGKLDESKLGNFIDFMKQSQSEGETAGLRQPPGGPECPTQ